MTGEWMGSCSLPNLGRATCAGSARDRILASIGNGKGNQGGKALRYRLPTLLAGRINQERETLTGITGIFLGIIYLIEH